MFCIAPVNDVGNLLRWKIQGIPTVPVYPWEGDKPLDVGGSRCFVTNKKNDATSDKKRCSGNCSYVQSIMESKAISGLASPSKALVIPPLHSTTIGSNLTSWASHHLRPLRTKKCQSLFVIQPGYYQSGLIPYDPYSDLDFDFRP